uniref:Uncharacterized protein n=1 Tax=Dunaliella tertiolecta TaxID=3047 RepID=A0A7S3VI82_DUNTE|mmetsp:Transcript_14284/g.38749  ORF Transcript_14284/g.38749 Transcript_14284/m.38749 type:complete len:360 (+) Transcript_14284:2757-3836(+)
MLRHYSLSSQTTQCSSSLQTCTHPLAGHSMASLSCIHPHKPCRRRVAAPLSAVEQDIDWEPSSSGRTQLTAPARSRSNPAPPPPPPSSPEWWEVPFMSRRNIALTMLTGSAGLWLVNNQGGVQFADKPNIPFKLLGYTDLAEKDFVYFKTAGGHWVGAAEDEAGRLFMIDEVGDLYYDSGDPAIGMYAMDTQGNLFNFYNDVGGERKITPVGNIAEMKSFKVNELAGVKLDRNINVVAFSDGRQIPLPPGTGYVDEFGNFKPPGELVEGFTRSKEERNPFSALFGGSDPADSPPDRFEVDLDNPDSFERQMYDEILFDDPTLPDYQPALPDDFDLEELAREVEQERRANSWRKPMPPPR